MRAIVLKTGRVRFDREFAEPTAAPGEVLVKVLCAGICETDLQLMQGYMGFQGVLGHEFVGIAEGGQFAGQRVVGEINCSCGTCDLCQRGLGIHCPNRSVLGILHRDGAFADYISLPEKNLHRVPDEVGSTAAVFTEPLAAAFEILEQVPISADQRIVVLGDGRLGNLCAQVLRLRCPNVRVIGKHEHKLQLLRDLGLAAELLANVRPERTADVVVDCTGSSSGLPTALQLVRPRGTIVLKTTVAGNHDISMAQIVIDEITLIGSRCGPFAVALQALQEGSVDVACLLESVYPLSAGVEALQAASSTPALKILLAVDETQDWLAGRGC